LDKQNQINYAILFLIKELNFYVLKLKLKLKLIIAQTNNCCLFRKFTQIYLYLYHSISISYWYLISIYICTRDYVIYTNVKI